MTAQFTNKCSMFNAVGLQRERERERERARLWWCVCGSYNVYYICIARESRAHFDVETDVSK
jgi:hypothetical protein